MVFFYVRSWARWPVWLGYRYSLWGCSACKMTWRSMAVNTGPCSSTLNELSHNFWGVFSDGRKNVKWATTKIVNRQSVIYIFFNRFSHRCMLRFVSVWGSADRWTPHILNIWIGTVADQWIIPSVVCSVTHSRHLAGREREFLPQNLSLSQCVTDSNC